jgi:hypothetical protein
LAGAGAIWPARCRWLGDLDGDQSSTLPFFVLITILTKRIKKNIKNDYFNKINKNLNNRMDDNFENC